MFPRASVFARVASLLCSCGADDAFNLQPGSAPLFQPVDFWVVVPLFLHAHIAFGGARAG
eukprot:11147735-Lingulodinium_polyedra.AAC.1